MLSCWGRGGRRHANIEGILSNHFSECLFISKSNSYTE